MKLREAVDELLARDRRVVFWRALHISRSVIASRDKIYCCEDATCLQHVSRDAVIEISVK